tara:strand:- start:8089 stop:9117 length:1029 start_codon:yes stop_codon:yes gene_type:complete
LTKNILNLKDIANLAQTSSSSVSRVINSSGYVKKEVRDRIQVILDETGYRPNAFAKALHSKKSLTIGVILPKINATSSGENVAGIDDYFSKKGYSVILGNTNHSLDKEFEYLDLFKEKQVDGIILIATTLSPEHQARIKRLHIPIVIMGQKSLDGTPCVVFNEIAAAQELTNYLLANKHHNIGYIGVSEEDISVGIERRQGYLNALEKHGIKKDQRLLSTGAFSVISGYDACQRIFEQFGSAPDAIFAANDKMAIGAINYILDQGLSIPGDVSVCGVGGGVFAQHYNPKITSLFYDSNSAGKIAASLLYRLILSEEKDFLKNHIEFVQYKLVIRNSVKLNIN